MNFQLFSVRIRTTGNELIRAQVLAPTGAEALTAVGDRIRAERGEGLIEEAEAHLILITKPMIISSSVSQRDDG